MTVLGLLTILFVGLKLTGYIAWSWFWVVSPIWIEILLLFLFLALYLLVPSLFNRRRKYRI